MHRIRTISAVVKKDFIQMVRYPTWIIQMLIWPLIFPLMYILSAVGMAGPGGGSSASFQAVTGTNSFMGYIVVGTMAWMWVNITMWSFGTTLREEQMRGTLESNWLCPINRIDLLVGGAFISALQGFIIAVISVLEYRFIYGIHFTGNPLTWILVFLIMVPGVYGVGVLFASLVLWAKEANAAVNVVRGIMMIVCGITFPIAVMPKLLQTASKFIPFTYGIEISREVMIKGTALSAIKGDILICIFEGLIFLLLGRIAFRGTENKVKEFGSLERF